MANQYLAKLGILMSVDTAEMSKGFNEAEQKTKQLSRTLKREAEAAAKELARIEEALNDYGKEISLVTKMERAMQEGGKYFNLGQNEAKRQFILKEAAALDALAASQKKVNSAQLQKSGLSAYQMQALSYQTTDIITSLAGGQNPLLVLLQQGGQLKDQFGGLGNVFNAFKQALTLSKIAIGGVVTALGTLAYAYYQGDKEAKEFRNTLILTNNAAGLTASSFQALGQIIAGSTNTGIRDAKEVLTELAKSGKFSRETLIPVAELISNIGRLSGQTGAEVVKSLIPSLDGTSASAKSLNQQYHFLNVEQYRQIEILEQQGKRQEAIVYMTEIWNKKIKDQKEELGTLEKVLLSATQAWQGFKDALYGIGRPDTTTDKLVKIREAIEDAQKMPAFTAGQREARDKWIKDRLADYDVLAKELIDKQKQANEKSETEKQNEAAIERQNLKEQQNLDFELRQKYIDAGIAQAAVGEDKIAAIRAEAVKKMAKASLDAEKAITQGGGKNQDRIIRNLKQDFETINEEAKKQIAEVNRQEAKKFQDRQAAEELTIKSEKEKLELYKENILLDDVDLKIAMDRLQTEKNIADIMRSGLDKPEKEAYADRERALQSSREEIVKLGEHLKLLKDINASVFRNMTDAITNFVLTGKLNFKNFAATVIMEILRIQAAALAAQATKGIFGLFSAGSSAVSLGTMALGANASAATGFGINPSAGGFGIRASGGAVAGNSPYMVGERGPELFVPNSSGTIIPNGQGSDMGGVTNVTNNYINAIDTKSFEDRIYGSANAVWAANQYAGNKNIATSRSRT